MLLIDLNTCFFKVENDWEIGFKKVEINDLKNINLNNIKWLKMPKKVYYADPFVISINNLHYIFFEEYLKKDKYGIISCIRLDEDFKIIDKKIIIDENLHFSFPNIFEDQGKVFMIPETESKNKLSLYIATIFPFKWIELNTLLNFGCADPEIHKHENKWYLIYSKTGSNNELYLRINNVLTHGWNKCEEFLIKKGGISRNGGKIFKLNQSIYRVSQNCETKYGKEIHIYKIINLSGENYHEEFISKINPISVNGSCTHTLNFNKNLVVIDRLRERIFLKSPMDIFFTLKSKIFTSKTKKEVL